MNRIPQQNLNKKSQKLLLLFLVLASFVLVYILNDLYPLFGEDWDYSFFWTLDGQNVNRLTSVSDILMSQYNHYIIWGGRSIAHAIAQFLILIGSPWNSLINTSIYILFVFLVYRIVNYNNETSVRIFLFISFALWFFLPNMPSLIVWLTYSSVYLWGTFIPILFIYPFYKYYRSPFKFGNNILASILILAMGVIAGWTYENISLALVSFLAILFIVMKTLKIKIPNWMIFGFIGVLIGCALLMLAPGNFKRAAGFTSSNFSLFYTILYRVWDFLNLYISHLIFLFVLYFATLYLFIKKYDGEDKKKLMFMSFALITTAHIGLLVMLASPNFPPRTLFGVVVFMILATGILFANIRLITTTEKSISWITIAIISVCFFFNYRFHYTCIDDFSSFWKQRELYVEEQKRQGVKDVVFHDYLIMNPNYIESNYEFKSFVEGWPNFAYAKYYELNSVRIK